jgi:hypothetical protein
VSSDDGTIPAIRPSPAHANVNSETENPIGNANDEEADPMIGFSADLAAKFLQLLARPTRRDKKHFDAPSKARGGRRQSFQEQVADTNVALMRNENRKLIYPTDRSMQRWDVALICCLMITMVSTPFEIAFLTVTWRDKLWWVNRLIDFFFFTDMFIQFDLAFNDDSGVLVKDRGKIAARYARGWFPIDLVSIFPFENTDALFSSSHASPQQLKMMRMLRLLRLIKMLRLLRASRIFTRLEVGSLLPHAFFFSTPVQRATSRSQRAAGVKKMCHVARRRLSRRPTPRSSCSSCSRSCSALATGSRARGGSPRGSKRATATTCARRASTRARKAARSTGSTTTRATTSGSATTTSTRRRARGRRSAIQR